MIVNIAAYRFVPLDRLADLRAQLLERCAGTGIRGTVLLAGEGINLFLAGSASDIAHFRRGLDADARLANLDYRETRCERMPLRRLKIRIKSEIIAFGVPEIDPARQRAPALQPEALRSWLDAGRAVVLLDTRNTVEFTQGSFAGAVHLGNDSFRDFAVAARQFRPRDADVPIVAFCTGGIRCEKAAPLLQQLGHPTVYQLAGGILQYFRKVGSAHYHGNCFVFDERGALDPRLEPCAVQNIVQL